MHMSVVSEQSLFISGPVGRLEAMWLPSATNSGQVAVICHPHPLYGGSMDNKVVTTLARTWRDAGVATLRFNFRGVGKSEGKHASGVGEVDDLLAVVDWLQREKGLERLSLAGFSFGAWIAAAVVERLPAEVGLQELVLVAPPVQYPGFQGLKLHDGTVILQGDADDVVSPADVVSWATSRNPPPEVVCFPGAGHFFHGRLADLRAELTARLKPLA
jgi:alpha/beta superfamily hydrolase